MFEQMLSITFLTTFLTASVRMAIPLVFAGLGETYSEKAGILNIGVEAIMLSGAFLSFAFTYITGSLWIGLLGGMLGGLIVSLIHALFSINFKKDQTVTGIALNMLMLGSTSYMFKVLVGKNPAFPQINTFTKMTIPFLSDIPIIGPAFFDQDIIVYGAYILVILSTIFLYRTMWGLSLTAVGEHPRAADTVGIKVYIIRYFAAAINGILGGLGGAYLTLVQLGVFMENVTAGRGYIALALVIFGRRNPIGIFLGALLFGAADAFQFRLQAIGIQLPSQYLTMLPYVITLVVLLFSFKNSNDPQSLGKSYVSDSR